MRDARKIGLAASGVKRRPSFAFNPSKLANQLALATLFIQLNCQLAQLEDSS